MILLAGVCVIYKVGDSIPVAKAKSVLKTLNKRVSKTKALGFPAWWFIPSYLCFLFTPFTIFGCLFNLIQIIIATKRKRIWGLYALLFGPLVVCLSLFFWSGVIDYFRADGRLISHGLPGPEYANINRKYRCRRSSGGCCVDGSELLRETPYNFALTTLITTLGPMKGSFKGRYPTRKEAFDALKKSQQTISMEELRALSEGIESQTIQSNMSQEAKLHGHYRLAYPYFPKLSVKLAQLGETLIVGSLEEAALIDRETGWIYSYYNHPPFDEAYWNGDH